MSGNLSRVKSAWLMPESTYATVPDATGAQALFIPADLDEGYFPKDDQEPVQRNWMTGRNKRTPHRLGVKKGALSCKAMAGGYTTSVSNPGDPPPTRQWFDYVLEAFLGTALSHNAGTVGNASTTTSLVLSAGTPAVGVLAPIYGASTNGGYIQWARLTGSGPYTMSPAIADAPANADHLYAARTYYPKVVPGSLANIGATLSLVSDVDGVQYLNPGARPSKCALKAEAGMPAQWDMQFLTDSRIRQAFASLPNAPVADPEPCILRLCPVNINGTAYDVASVEIDFGITVQEIKASTGPNARSGWAITGVHPVIKVDPLNDTDFEDLWLADTAFEVLIQFGDGALVNSHLNSIAFHAENAKIQGPPNESNDGGIVRKPLTIIPVDAGASGASAYYWQLGIC